LVEIWCLVVGVSSVFFVCEFEVFLVSGSGVGPRQPFKIVDKEIKKPALNVLKRAFFGSKTVV